ncbi:hypothetical protein GPROT1_02520 [Gammaproteobacteria bacterium]|nr:hypothetical protein GPROT1_02520 [Gammaproteobacteria bacterium]
MNAIAEVIIPRPVWTVTKFAGDAAFEAGEHYEKSVIEGNLLLNEGITELLALLTGGSANAFSNANARLGVGDSATAAAAAQTALQASTNKLYKAMEAGYPAVANQSVSFRSVFGSSEANFAWEEFSVMNGSDEATSKNLNRKVSSQGTKASGQTWQLDLTITFS